MIEIIKMEFGSKVYGTSVPTSDTDYKGIFIPEPRSLILQNASKNINKNTKLDSNVKNTKDDVDEEWFSYSEFLKLLLQGQTMALDMLFTPPEYWVHNCVTKERLFTKIQNQRYRFLHSGTSAFAGYCQNQASKYSLKGSNLAAYRLAYEFFSKQDKYIRVEDIEEQINEELIKVALEETKYHDKGEPIIRWIEHPERDDKMGRYLQIGHKTKHGLRIKCGLAADIWKNCFDKYGERAKMAETNDGVDWKALMHAVRIAHEAEELLLTHYITFPRPEAHLLLKIRKGELPYKEVADLITQGLDNLNLAKEKTTLPPKPDYKFAEELIVEVYGNAISKIL